MCFSWEDEGPEEWHNKDILKKFDNISWYDSINKLHKPENGKAAIATLTVVYGPYMN